MHCMVSLISPEAQKTLLFVICHGDFLPFAAASCTYLLAQQLLLRPLSTDRSISHPGCFIVFLSFVSSVIITLTQSLHTYFLCIVYRKFSNATRQRVVFVLQASSLIKSCLRLYYSEWTSHDLLNFICIYQNWNEIKAVIKHFSIRNHRLCILACIGLAFFTLRIIRLVWLD